VRPNCLECFFKNFKKFQLQNCLIFNIFAPHVKKKIPPLLIENFPMTPKAWWNVSWFGKSQCPETNTLPILIVGSYKQNMKCNFLNNYIIDFNFNIATSTCIITTCHIWMDIFHHINQVGKLHLSIATGHV
jgi:hypothetical protein